MEIKSFFFLLPFFASGCTLPAVSTSPASFRDVFDKVEKIKWESTVEQVKTIMGTPGEQIQDETSKTMVLRYIEKNGVQDQSRAYFVFESPLPKMKTKYFQIYDEDRESQLNYWKQKFAAADFKMEQETSCQGHSLAVRQFVDVNQQQRLDIENGKVVRVIWNKSPVEKSQNCRK